MVRVFFYPERKDYLTLHTHDLNLDIFRQNFIYLYRDPVNTIFSQISYHEESLNDKNVICHWANLYGEHLSKWLCDDNTKYHKTVIKYESFQQNPEKEFEKICNHFSLDLDKNLLRVEMNKVTRREVKKRTQHDKMVINLDFRYSDKRSEFNFQYSDYIWDVLLKNRNHLKKYFDI